MNHCEKYRIRYSAIFTIGLYCSSFVLLGHTTDESDYLGSFPFIFTSWILWKKKDGQEQNKGTQDCGILWEPIFPFTLLKYLLFFLYGYSTEIILLVPTILSRVGSSLTHPRAARTYPCLCAHRSVPSSSCIIRLITDVQK